MNRPDPNRNTQVAAFMNEWGLSEKEVKFILQKMSWAYDWGRKEGQKEAQRFFRLSLGIEEPEPKESAYWQNPVPLKEKAGA